MKKGHWFLALAFVVSSLGIFQNCNFNHKAETLTSHQTDSPAPISSFLNTTNLSSTASNASTTDTYVYTSSFQSTGAAQTYTCTDGYSIVSATSTATSGASSCLTYVNGASVTYGGCSGSYFLQVVCAKTVTNVFTSTNTSSQTDPMPNLVLSATDIEVPSGRLSCIPGISGKLVTHGGCGLEPGQTGYRFMAISAPVVDTKVFRDSYAGFDGVTARVMTCPSGYSAVSATEISTSGALQCIPMISDNKVYYSACDPTTHGNYHLTAVCAKITGSGISTASPTSETYKMANTCKPPRHYRFSVQPGQEVHLKCGADAPTSILRAQIKDRGRTLARGVMVMGNKTSAIPFWNSYILVGNPKVAYGVGDDICPQASSEEKTVMGYGDLIGEDPVTKAPINEPSAFVDWKGYAGAEVCPPGSDGGIVVYSGSYLDVWVEDPSEGCVGKDVGLVSSYDTYTSATNTPEVNAIYPASSFPYYAWTNSMTQLTSIWVPPTTERSKIQVFSSVEGSPNTRDPKFQYACGATASALITQIYSNNLGIVASAQGQAPTIGGMGHLVLSAAPSSPLPYDARYLRSFSIWVGSNLSPEVPVTTNGCCGDGKIGFVKEP